MEVPRLGDESELQLLAYTTAMATWDLSRICDLHYSPQQHRILNPLSEARNLTLVLMVTSQVCYRFHLTVMGLPRRQWSVSGPLCLRGLISSPPWPLLLRR